MVPLGVLDDIARLFLLQRINKPVWTKLETVKQQVCLLLIGWHHVHHHHHRHELLFCG